MGVQGSGEREGKKTGYILVNNLEFCCIRALITCGERDRSASGTRAAAVHCLHNNGIPLSTGQTSELAGGAHVAAGGVFPTGGGGRQHTVACGCHRAAPADQSFTRGAVVFSRHVGRRTRGWEKERHGKMIFYLVHQYGCYGEFT